MCSLINSHFYLVCGHIFTSVQRPAIQESTSSLMQEVMPIIYFIRTSLLAHKLLLGYIDIDF